MRGTHPNRALVRFSQSFYQGSLTPETDLDEFVANALARLSAAEVSELKNYLSSILDSNADNGDLKKIWKMCDSDYGFKTPNTFFRLILTTEPKRGVLD